MADREQIERFARDVLGCGCPDEVFEQIECHAGPTDGVFPMTHHITIGGRLLVYVYDVSDPEPVEAHLPQIVASGRAERDRRGLNRFRAVLVTDDVAGLTPVAERVFAALDCVDEKVHLHVVGREAVHGL